MSGFIHNRGVFVNRLRHTARLFVGVSLTVLAGSTSASEYRDLENVAPDSAQAVTLGLEDIDQPLRILPRRYILRDRLADNVSDEVRTEASWPMIATRYLDGFERALASP